jgi:predicted RecB family nuclease
LSFQAEITSLHEHPVFSGGPEVKGKSSDLVPSPLLSKSRFIAGLQCPLRLWYQCFSPQLASPVSPAQRAIFEVGREVGRLATGLYPEGIVIKEGHSDHDKAVESTRTAIGDPEIPAILEAAFVHKGLRIRVDILERLSTGKWNLIEVKSSTSPKQAHLPDVAIQRYVVQGSGEAVQQCGVLHPNAKYVYQGGDLDLKDLFSFSDLTERIEAMEEEIPLRLRQLEEMLSGTSPPDIRPSRLCRTPHVCEFLGHCTRDKPEFWIMELSGISQKKLDKLAKMNIEDIRDIPASFPLTSLQTRIRDTVSKGTRYFGPKLADELRDVEYPVHFLDFETIGSAIPRYPGTRPYQALPFQWSDHILYEDGTIVHREYLCDRDRDPRDAFAASLLETLGQTGTIFVFTMYEKEVIRQLVDFLPQHRDLLLRTENRFKDLHALVKKHVYHPGFHGSFSLKSILPALVPSMGYEDLAVQDGQQASVAYLHMLDPNASPEKRAEVRRALLSYCANDTLGLVRIREELLKQMK